MYKVYSDSYLIHSDAIDALKINNAKVDLEVNKTGAFEFTIYPEHPYYEKVKKLKSIITVYQDDYLLFRGRVLNEEIGFYDERQVVCEGQLAFLLDSIQKPYDFLSGSNHTTIKELLTYFIENHNSQVEEAHQFKVGNITVIDGNDYIVKSESEYINTWESINKKLIDSFGGYIWVRNEADGNYIDYLSDFTLLSPQKIEFGKNLLDLKKIRKGEDIATVLIPLGAKMKDEEGNEIGRLTIASVNGGSEFLENTDLISQYGRIVRSYTWDDVTEPSGLMAKGNSYFTDTFDTIELTSADLMGIESFHIGTYVQVISKPHGINQRFLVSKLSIDLNDPTSNKLVLGGIIDSLTEQTKKNYEQQDNQFVVVREEVAGVAEQIIQTEQNLQSSIESSAENITLAVAENFYLKDETESLISSVQTELNLTKDALNLEFTTFQTDLEALATGTDAEFEEIKKYIRFIDGKILLGEAGNELELQIANDKISFIQEGAEVAYFTDRKLFVTDGEYTNSLRLGSFAFMPRANGNLSFKKV